MLFVDTPGMHGGEQRALNRFMNRAAGAALAGVDVVVMVVDRDEWHEDDERVLQRAAAAGAPVILAINKVDRLEDKSLLLPLIESLAKRGDFAALVPVSALRAKNLEQLEMEVSQPTSRGTLPVRGGRLHRSQRAFPRRGDRAREADATAGR
jgi:GTP-binding protein Era